MIASRVRTRLSSLLVPLRLAAVPLLAVSSLAAQSPLAQPANVQRIELISGRSFPISGGPAISKVTVANPLIADVVVIGETDVVINGIAAGETDIILWGATNVPRRHYRVIVRSSPERRQVLLSVKFAEVRKDALRNIGTALQGTSTNGNTCVGTGSLTCNSTGTGGADTVSVASRFLTVLTTFNSRQLLGLLEAEEQIGNARSLAEPNLMAANREDASFLAGGEIPIPIVQPGANGGGQVAIQFREFGIRLNFNAEVLSDSLIKLKVRPEVSSLDYANSILLQGFRIPALRTRRIESTVDVLQDRSLIISGLFNEERERVKTGIPFLVNIPILGDLLSSQRWLRSESELIVIVTPTIMDPNNPRQRDLIRLVPDTTTPAKPALQKRLPPPPR